MNEYFVKVRPGIAAQRRLYAMQSQIATYDRVIESKTAEIAASPENAKGTRTWLSFEIKEIEQLRDKLLQEGEECRAIIAAAPANEHLRQEGDYYVAARREFEKAEMRAIGFFAHQVEEALLISKEAAEDVARNAPYTINGIVTERIRGGMNDTNTGPRELDPRYETALTEWRKYNTVDYFPETK